VTKVTAAWDVDIEKIGVQQQPGEKASEMPSQQTSLVWWHVPVIPARQEVQGQPKAKSTIQINQKGL
jgi:hypothetical protein